MNKKKNTKLNLILKWIHNHRIKVGVWLFLVILPISLIITAYVGSYTSNKSVYFEQEITEESEKIRNFVSADELKAITLDIEWDALKKPVENNDGILVQGYYRFDVRYFANGNFDIVNVKITPVLKTDWKNLSSVGVERPISTNFTTFAIDFNYDLPITPLLFVKVEEPNLYLKVEYTYTSAGQDVTEVEYVKFPLEDLNPDIVIPN
ncbi:hypothetical protein BK011_04125 [Tenericutes bacterium MZ-XQ]|jgi:hypothetical protein|nr:hypothetical protein BK011_04125 [Tenericutes bacterium MZ-XQ]